MYSWERRKVIKGVTFNVAGLLLMNNWLGSAGIVLWFAGVWAWERLR
jgi:hypothetical protein